MSSQPTPRLGVLTFGDLTVSLPSEYVLRAPSLNDPSNDICKHCNARTWREETINCCSSGKYVVEPLIPLSSDVEELYKTKHFLQNQRRYNGLFSFTAMGAAPTPTWTQPSYPSMLQLHGRSYHRIMDAFQTYSERVPLVNKARLYMYDSNMLQHAAKQKKLDQTVVANLSAALHANNSWIKTYKSILLEVNQSDPSDNVGIEFAQVTRQTHGPVVGDAPPPSGKEIAALIFKDDAQSRSKRFVYTFPRTGPGEICDRPRFVPIWSPTYSSLQYPLLLFHGEPGWSPGYYKEDPPYDSRTLSTTCDKPIKIWTFVRQRILCEKVFHILSVLAQEYACDAYSRQEDSTLDYIGSNKCQKRITQYKALRSAVGTTPTGKKLPTAFHASPANRKKRQLDGMAVVTRKGRPSLMVTVTCNGFWPEIQANLLPGQCAMDRPDLCNRVFKIKLKAIMNDLKNNLYGKAIYHLSVIEFQKRGMPHSHIVIRFDGLSPEARQEVGKWVWTNLPDERIAGGKLREKVIKYMVHQKCGEFNPNAPCMTTDHKTNRKHCSKHYPQPFRDNFATDPKTGRAEYRRLDNRDTATIKQKNGANQYVETEIDNRYIVPYNPYLLMKYDCHICVDLVTAMAVVAYIYKYCYKGPDMAKARIMYDGDEIEAYKSIRYISSSEAMWRIFGFDMQSRSPGVILLYVHLEGQQVVIHDEDDTAEQRRELAKNSQTDLMRYFRRPTGEPFDELTFLDYFEQFTVEPKQRRRKRGRRNQQRNESEDDNSDGYDSDDADPTATPNRIDGYGNYVYRRRSQCVCRVNFLKPDSGDVWYLRLLLHHIASQSWEQIRTVDAVLHESHQSAAHALGLVADAQEYDLTLRESLNFSTPRELRSLLVTLIIAGAPARDLWDTHKQHFMTDYMCRMSESSATDSALRQLDVMLAKHGKTTASVGLPHVSHPDTEYHRLLAAFNREDMRQEADGIIPKLNSEQRTVFDAVVNSVRNKAGGIFMIDAPAGSGKTFTMTAISADLRAKGNLVLCSASTGIAALLLPGGLTAHSTFKIPFGDNLVQGSVCNVKAETERAEVLRRADLIIWDEIPMSDKLAPEALDLTLRDLRRCDKPFGGATVLFGGDWRQVGPVVVFGTPADVVEASLISSYLWGKVQRFRLVQSMRDRLDKPYSRTVRAVGEGLIPPVTLPDESVIIPLEYTLPEEHDTESHPTASLPSTCSLSGTTEFQTLIDFVYPDILTAQPAEFADRGILSPTNASTDEINDHILNLLPNQLHSLKSSNTIIKSNPKDIEEVTSVEFLEKIDVPGVPPHQLDLKVGCIVMFIRNVNFDSGIVNGRKGIVRAISPRIVDVEIIAPGSPLVKVPRILFEVKVGRQGMCFHRRQFPLRVCYAMTINKSQGQTLARVGLDLRSDVFCHGQLYVALSRTTSSNSVLLLVQPERLINGVPHVANCVYAPFIEAATGNKLPEFNPIFYQPPNSNPPSRPSLPAPDQPQPPSSWNIVDEVGDGACLLRTIARKVFGDPEYHHQVRQQIVSHIHANQDYFFLHIQNGFGNEPIHVQGSSPQIYHSVQQYLQIMALPTAYAGYIEIAAAEILYGVTIEVRVAGTNYPPPADPHQPNILTVLFHANSLHYCTLSPSNAHNNNDSDP